MEVTLQAPPPLVGQIWAGFPSPATEALSDTITLHEYLVEHPTTTFFYTVPDDAMCQRGIHRGDIVVVESRPAKTGDLVLAEVDDEIVLRGLQRDPFGVFLEPANMDYECMFKCVEMQVLGVVVGLARRC